MLEKTYTHAHTHTHTHIHTHTPHTHSKTHAITHTNTHIHTHTRARAHTHTHTHTHIFSRQAGVGKKGEEAPAIGVEVPWNALHIRHPCLRTCLSAWRTDRPLAERCNIITRTPEHKHGQPRAHARAHMHTNTHSKRAMPHMDTMITNLNSCNTTLNPRTHTTPSARTHTYGRVGASSALPIRTCRVMQPRFFGKKTAETCLRRREKSRT